ncbi:Trp biosynthesis-associated membrane protein [Sanguibacter suaedae]|uniref:Trp biosynthesis-associated membrane protein n=1 Tax=Sanguibacter suaedae TaxID=2795737 RepID=A0A934IBQ6_9MICO|nr:Trp biosynthesis-associated membrane protein [Sanguibacter suaedae]MBI9114936.1 Trp biosynthesis-associated membrane protein [Sanguibacter suaedae]
MRVPTRRTAVLSGVLLGGAALLSAVPAWITTTSSTALGEEVSVTVTGTQAAPGVTAAALVVLAASLALGLVGRAGRWVVLGSVALGGLVVAASAVLVVTDPQGPARSAVAEVTGVVGPVGEVDVGVAPFLTVVLGVLLVVLATAAALGAGRWDGRSRRYDAAPGVGATPVAAESSEGAVRSAGSREPAGDAVLDERDAWDALTHGDDPT